MPSTPPPAGDTAVPASEETAVPASEETAVPASEDTRASIESDAEVAGAPVPAPRHVGRRRPVSRRRVVAEWVVVVVVALAVATLVRTTMVQAFYIPSESMVPTLRVGDQLLVDKVTFRLRDPRRGDVVVFERPPGAADRSIKDLVKRIVGLPGETIESRADGRVYVNGLALDEPYVRSRARTDGISRQIVPVDSYYVLGDNRAQSADSRTFGPIDRSLIVGRAFFRVFPPSRIGRF